MFQISMKLVRHLKRLKNNNDDRNSKTIFWKSNPPILSPSFKKIEET